MKEASNLNGGVGQTLFFTCRYSSVTLTYPPRMQASQGTTSRACCGTRCTQCVENVTWPNQIQMSLWGMSLNACLGRKQHAELDTAGQKSVLPLGQHGRGSNQNLKHDIFLAVLRSPLTHGKVIACHVWLHLYAWWRCTISCGVVISMVASTCSWVPSPIQSPSCNV